MSGKAIKREFLPRFRGLPRHSGAKAGLILASYLLQIALAMKLGAQLAGSGTGTGIAAAAVAAAFIATRLRGLNNIVHECSHATFARDPASNEAFGKIAAALTFVSFGEYRKAHLTHHIRGMLLGSCGSGASGHPLLPAVVLSSDLLSDSRLRRALYS